MQIPGPGVTRAQALCLNLDQDIRTALDAFAANEPPAEIGTHPGFFDGRIDALEHLDILKLVYFCKIHHLNPPTGVVGSRRYRTAPSH